MRHLRQEQGKSLDALAVEVDLSKVFLSKIERGERRPSVESAQAISKALGEPIEDLFPTDGRKGPQEAANFYLDSLRARRSSEGVPESEFDRDMRAHGLDPDEEASTAVAYWADDETIVIDFSRMDAATRSARVKLPPARNASRRPSSQRRGKRASGKTSSSDDPGEPHLESPSAREAEHAGTVDSFAVSGTARLSGRRR